MDDNKENNFINTNKSSISKIIIPHNTKLNNFKSNKYFSHDNNYNSMKEALIKYREKSQKNEKNDTINKTRPSNSSTDISNINLTKQRFNKNNTIKLDKNLFNYAEERTKIKEFHKIQPKIIDSFFLDDGDYVENFLENGLNEEEEKKEDFIIGNKNLIYNNISVGKYNKTIKMQKNMKNKKKINLSITITNDNEETIINENDYGDNEFFYKEIDKKEKQNNINKNNENNLINKSINLNEINLEYLLIIEKLYTELMKDLDINNIEIYQNKLSIIKDFLYIIHNEQNFYLFDIIDSKKINNNNIDLILKEYIIEEIVFFYIIILIGLIKKEKNIFYTGLHNLSFYFHQSFIIFIFIIINNINFENNNNKCNELGNNIKLCMKIIDENKTWLDKTNYKKYLETNNSLSKQILINILNQIKFFFQSNSFLFSNNNQNNNMNFNNSNSQIIDECINLFLLYLKSYQNLKINDLIKEIQNFSSINQLLQIANLDKIMSHFDTEDNNNENLEQINEEYNIENNTYNEEMPTEPFLKPINPKYKYTLVLDLDETLVHFISDNEFGYIQIRPGAEDFLKELSEFYEIIIFTAALQNYADKAIEGIDPDGVVSDKLYRRHTINMGNVNIKDLDKLGRDLKHVIIIDNCKENYCLQPNNGLNIIDFEGNEYDDELEYLKDDLLKLVKLNPDDVRYYLNDIQKGMDKRAIYFQKVNNENKYKEEYIIDNNIDIGFNDKINNKIKKEETITESKGKNNKKGYSFTEESEVGEKDKNNY